LTSVRQTCTMFYAGNLFIFLPRHFLQNSLFGFRQLPQLRNSAMVDLEGLLPSSAAASHRKVSHRHCGQVGSCFSIMIVLCLLCLLCSLYLLYLLYLLCLLCLLRFFCFCLAIVIVCAPHPIFLPFFTLFLVACWLSLIPWL
jgi:hypothetical protein